MEKPRQLRQEEISANPLLWDLLERAKAGTESVISFGGVTVIVQPVEDITHTFTAQELKEFAEDYAAADDEEQMLTVEQAMALHRGQNKLHG
jgi:hypothetical protein